MSENLQNQRVVDHEHPWLGLSSYRADARLYFFGRTREIEDLFVRVRDQGLTVLYAQSGVGKTSLLNAGLAPKLAVEGYRPVLVRLGFDPSEPPLLEQTLNALEAASPGAIRHPAGSAQPTLWEVFHHAASRPADFGTAPLVVIFDQFEEVFTLATTPARRAEVEALLGQLADLAENRPPAGVQDALRADRARAREYDFGPSPGRILITLREDYLFALEDWKKLMPSLMRNRQGMTVLDGRQSLEAVVGPGRRGGRELVSNAVGELIVRRVASADAATPLEEISASPSLLSLLCDELNEARLRAGAATITAQQVERESGDILQNFYTRAFAGLHKAVQSFIEDRLVTVGGHRYPVAEEDALAALQEAGVPEPRTELGQLIGARFLSTGKRGEVPNLEITHDVLTPLVVRSRNERRAREIQEKAERDASAQRRRLVWGTSLAAVFTALATLWAIQYVLARKGFNIWRMAYNLQEQAHDRAVKLHEKASADLKAGFEQLAAAEAKTTQAGQIVTQGRSGLTERQEAHQQLGNQGNELAKRVAKHTEDEKLLAKEWSQIRERLAECQESRMSLSEEYPGIDAGLREARRILDGLAPVWKRKYANKLMEVERRLPDARVTLANLKIGIKNQQILESMQAERMESLETERESNVETTETQREILAGLERNLTTVRETLKEAQWRVDESGLDGKAVLLALQEADLAVQETAARLLGYVALIPAPSTLVAAMGMHEAVRGIEQVSALSSVRILQPLPFPDTVAAMEKSLPHDVAKVDSAIFDAVIFLRSVNSLQEDVDREKAKVEAAKGRVTAAIESVEEDKQALVNLGIKLATLVTDVAALEEKAKEDAAKVWQLVSQAKDGYERVTADAQRIKADEGRAIELLDVFDKNKAPGKAKVMIGRPVGGR